MLEPSGCFLNAYLRGVQERSYIYVPNHLVGLAAWFRVVGFSAFKARVYSVCWSALALIALYYILRRAFTDHRIAQFATFLVAIDFIFLWSSADGRPEAATNALMLCSIAAYLHFRERSYSSAVLASQILAATAAFTHPNALFVVLSMAVVAWRFDRKHCRPVYFLLAAIPYLVFAALWAIYIMQAPRDFMAQFLPNVGYAERWKGILRPDLAISDEIHRHLAAYSLDGVWTVVMNVWMLLIPFAYLIALLWILRVRKRLESSTRVFVMFAVVSMGVMTYLNGFKAYFYLIYLVPIYDTVWAAWLVTLWRRSLDGKLVAGALATVFITIQLATSVQHIRADEYHRDYEPTVRDVEKLQAAGKTIVGTSALGFELGFSGFRDDAREGTYSGLTPDVLVVDRSYRLFAGMFEENEPKVFAHIVDTLTSHYRLSIRHGSFWIFERIEKDGITVPLRYDLIDLGKHDRADRLFNTLLAQASEDHRL